MRRHKMGKKQSQRDFSRKSGFHKKNLGGPMRGGIRL